MVTGTARTRNSEKMVKKEATKNAGAAAKAPTLKSRISSMDSPWNRFVQEAPGHEPFGGDGVLECRVRWAGSESP
jgi:hypothetical protein